VKSLLQWSKVCSSRFFSVKSFEGIALVAQSAVSSPVVRRREKGLRFFLAENLCRYLLPGERVPVLTQKSRPLHTPWRLLAHGSSGFRPKCLPVIVGRISRSASHLDLSASRAWP
jgi:hypothetical protein